MRKTAFVLSLLVLMTFAVMPLGCGGKEETTDPHEGHDHAQADAEDVEMVAVVNDTCPIMQSPIDPDAVRISLTRGYEGKKVGFCCAGCPEQWDDLSEEQKAQKLAAVSD
jgi:hypothetical protein